MTPLALAICFGMILAGFPLLALWGVFYQARRRRQDLGPVIVRYHGLYKPRLSPEEQYQRNLEILAEATRRYNQR